MQILVSKMPDSWGKSLRPVYTTFFIYTMEVVIPAL